MPSSTNPFVYEAIWIEVYNNTHKDYYWEFDTKKEANAWRFRALGFTNAVRVDADRSPEKAKKWATMVENMYKKVHLVAQQPNGKWRMTVKTRPAAPQPICVPVDIDTLDSSTIANVLSSKDTAEVEAERAASPIQPQQPQQEVTVTLAQEAREKSQEHMDAFMDMFKPKDKA